MCLKNNIGITNTNKQIWKEAKDETCFPMTFREVSLLQSICSFQSDACHVYASDYMKPLTMANQTRCCLVLYRMFLAKDFDSEYNGGLDRINFH